jgi:hypothetical protein
MAYEIDWWVDRMPTQAELAEILRGICKDAALPDDAFRLELDEALGSYDIFVSVLRDHAINVQRAFGDAHGWNLKAFNEHMNLPERSHLQPESGIYRVYLSLNDEEVGEDPPLPPVVLAGEGSWDNNVAWPLTELFAVELARRIGIHPRDEDRDSVLN